MYKVRAITVFTVFRLLTDFVCLYTYEFWLSLCKIARSSVILLLPLLIAFFYRYTARDFDNFRFRHITMIFSTMYRSDISSPRVPLNVRTFAIIELSPLARKCYYRLICGPFINKGKLIVENCFDIRPQLHHVCDS